MTGRTLSVLSAWIVGFLLNGFLPKRLPNKDSKMIKQVIWEFLWPPARLERIIRELDAEERIGVAKMRQEWRASETRQALKQYHRPTIFSELRGRQP